MKLSDIEFRTTCCGEHTRSAEVFRDDGVGFLIQQNPETEIYSVQIYEPDQRTLRTSVESVDASEIDRLLAA